MSREKVIELLGAQTGQLPNIWEYWIASQPCQVGGETIELDFKDDKVSAWRKVAITEAARTLGPWITTNMVFQSDASSPLIAKPSAQ
ncbi:hypothetical protein BH11CYA1_BH11CYA1_09930 [soil metagenome]